MSNSILCACSITDEARFFCPPSALLFLKEWMLLTSPDRLQQIKYVRYHSLITIATFARNSSDEAMAMDMKLTQIHQDEFPFLPLFPSPHQHRPVIELSHLSHLFPGSECYCVCKTNIISMQLHVDAFTSSYMRVYQRLLLFCVRCTARLCARLVEVKADEVGSLRERRWPARTDTLWHLSPSAWLVTSLM